MPLQQILTTLGYKYILHRSENYLEIIKGSTVNYYFLFVAKDESSADLIDCVVYRWKSINYERVN